MARDEVKLAAAREELLPDTLTMAHNGVNGFFPAPQVHAKVCSHLNIIDRKRSNKFGHSG